VVCCAAFQNEQGADQSQLIRRLQALPLLPVTGGRFLSAAGNAAFFPLLNNNQSNAGVSAASAAFLSPAALAHSASAPTAGMSAKQRARHEAKEAKAAARLAKASRAGAGTATQTAAPAPSLGFAFESRLQTVSLAESIAFVVTFSLPHVSPATNPPNLVTWS
jgi:hypothetical protein